MGKDRTDANTHALLYRTSMLFPHTTSPQGRRTFLATATATAASALAADNLFGSPLFSGIIDTHTHFYDPSRAEGVPWPSKDDAGLYRSVLPDEFVKLTEHLGVQGTVVVEASPWVEDNQWLIDLADTNTSIVGVVGNLPVGTGEFGALLERFSAHRIYRGVRINGDTIAKGLDSKLFVSDLLRFVEYELTVDVNHGAMPLVAINRLAARIPDLHVVIDHMGGTRMVGRDPNKDWVEQIRLVARHKNVFMKVSALGESATSGFENAPTDAAYYKPWLDIVWDAFGEDRVMFGSNWPVSNRAGSYKNILSIVNDFVAAEHPQARQQFFHDNSLAAYRWIDRSPT